MPSAQRTSIRSGALAVQGLVPLQRALRRVSGDAAKELKQALRGIAGLVQRRARENVSHRTGRHGDPNLPSLGSSLRVSATQKGSSVRTTQVYGPVQEFGGKVGRQHASSIRATHFLTKAVQQEQANVSHRLDGLLASFGTDFEK